LCCVVCVNSASDGEEVRLQSVRRGRGLELVLDGLERRIGTSDGHETLPENQPLSGNERTMQKGLVSTESEQDDEAVSQRVRLLSQHLGVASRVSNQCIVAVA
jgi:hypothetical protein